MKAKTHKIILIITLILLGACSAIPEQELSDPDWCYTFDFTSSNYGASISSGQWVNGVGLRSVSGALNAIYTHNQLVQPGQAIVYLTITSDGTPINLSYNLFGMTGNYSDNIPAFISSYELPVYPASAGINNTRASINLAVDSGDTITITALAVSGMGANPFASNACAPSPTGTSTPNQLPTVTASNTPTATNTVTLTPTITNTPGPTPRPIDYCYKFDFTVSDGGWSVWNPFGGPVSGQYSAGNGFVTTDVDQGATAYRAFTLRYPLTPVTGNGKSFKHITFEWTYTEGHSEGASAIPSGNTPLRFTGPNAATQNVRHWDTVSDGYQVITWTHPTYNTGYEFTLNFFDIYSFASTDQVNPRTFSGASTLHSIQIEGYGLSPFPPSNCGAFVTATPTPSPTGSPTATPSSTPTVDLTAVSATPTSTGTATPTFDQRCNFVNWSFDEPLGVSNWTSDGTQAIGSLIVADADELSQTVTLTGSSYFLTIMASIEDYGVSETDGTVNFIYDLTKPDSSNEIDDFSVTDESYFAFQDNLVQFSVPITTAPGLNQFTISADLASVDSVKIQSVCLSEINPDSDDDLDDNPADGNGGWQTCDEKITKPTSVIQIGGWIRFLWDSADQKIQCVIMPPINSVLNNFIGFAGWVWNYTEGLFQWGLGRLLPYLTGHLQNFFRILLALLRGGFGNFLDLFAFSDDLLRMREVAVKSGNIVTGYTSAAKSYMNTGEAQVINFVVAYTNTPAVAPYGLPNCISAPYEHSWCAVHWVMENTILYGLVGGLIIPVLRITVDLVILMYFTNVIRKFIKQLRDLLSD